MTLVSVITPTWQRHRLLLDRCIPSVWEQTHPEVEHLVVSDGPDPALEARLFALGYNSGGWPERRYLELGVHGEVPDWGVTARLAGLEAAKGDLIAYLDDDNAFRPHHLARLVAALEAPGVDFAYTRMLRHWGGGAADEVGADPPTYGRIDTSLVAHHPGLLERATWQPPHPGMTDQHAVDWDLVERWVAAGATWAHVAEVTVDYYL